MVDLCTTCAPAPAGDDPRTPVSVSAPGQPPATADEVFGQALTSLAADRGAVSRHFAAGTDDHDGDPRG